MLLSLLTPGPQLSKTPLYATTRSDLRQNLRDQLEAMERKRRFH
jgi:hypothetical protein